MPTGAPSASSASPAQPARASPTASSVTADRCTMREHATRRKSRNAAPPPPQEKKKKAMRHSLRRNIDRHARTHASGKRMADGAIGEACAVFSAYCWHLTAHLRGERRLWWISAAGCPVFSKQATQRRPHTTNLPTGHWHWHWQTDSLSLRVVPPDARASIHPSYIVNVARVHSFTHIFCSLYPPQDQQQSKKRRGNSVPPRRSLLAPFPCPGGDRYVVSSESPERV